jgi:hypothetical protein
MRVQVSWSTVSFGLILLCVAAIAAVTYYFLESRRIAAEEQRQRRWFEQNMATAELPEWNGATFDWSPDDLDYLADRQAYEEPAPTAEMPPVPPSEISGPMPELNTQLDPDAFIAAMEAQTDRWLTHYVSRDT